MTKMIKKKKKIQKGIQKNLKNKEKLKCAKKDKSMKISFKF